VTAPLIMVDGIKTDVATIRARFPQNPVATYVNGEYAWTPAQEAEFARKIRISVESDQPEAGKYARCLDVEGGAARNGDARPFIEYRKKANTTIYCSAANVRAVIDAVGDADLVPRWWIAWYWQRPGSPSVAQVAAEVRAQTGVNLPEAKIWACQYASYTDYDLSVVFGKRDFAR